MAVVEAGGIIETSSSRLPPQSPWSNCWSRPSGAETSALVLAVRGRVQPVKWSILLRLGLARTWHGLVHE